MKILVDTHALLWFASGAAQLSTRAKEILLADDTTRYVSMACWWEISIKHSLKKLHLRDGFSAYYDQCLEEGFQTFGIEPHHLQEVNGLPFHHRDPFDRLLIAQAIHEGLPIVTKDELFRSYDVEIIW